MTDKNRIANLVTVYLSQGYATAIIQVFLVEIVSPTPDSYMVTATELRDYSPSTTKQRAAAASRLSERIRRVVWDRMYRKD